MQQVHGGQWGKLHNSRALRREKIPLSLACFPCGARDPEIWLYINRKSGATTSRLFWHMC
ncbi:hypothetical protein CEW88_11280 [Alloyangia pacifica]|uniref:Uncharacterized protein n=1 Tax=Alloyangia pacifica TaxID=311180 RepID=A0A2U8HHJ5_9RHOB|nr:hypothetical protein CEW88_11280 [Alloyangia pacifica]